MHKERINRNINRVKHMNARQNQTSWYGTIGNDTSQRKQHVQGWQ